MSLDRYLASLEPDYDADRAMLARTWQGSGYHSRLAAGSRVHPTRDAFAYAVALLASRQERHVRRAQAVFAAVLKLQETDPMAATYGIWPYTLEESLAEMAPPDWNWADFCGAQIALALHDYPDLLETALAEDLRDALGHAAWSIFRRNVQPGYTNIAIMGGGVAAAAGELLDEPRLLVYGRRRLERFVEHTTWHGGLNEYNSPTYTLVAIHEAERILHLVRDSAVRRAAEAILRACWAMCADFFHPVCGQLCGPHSRAYADRLGAATVRDLSIRTGVDLPAHPTAAPPEVEPPELVPPVPCPADLLPRFERLPDEEVVVRRRFIRREPESASTVGTAWLGDQACLGTVNADTTWVQRRPLLGYWRAETDPAVVLTCRLLHDGREFASGLLRCAQEGPAALLLLSLLTNKGDWHDHLDRPADGAFTAESFAFQLDLSGEGVEAEDLGDGLLALRAAPFWALVRCGAARFDGAAVSWGLHTEPGRVAARATLYDGPARRFDFRELGTCFVAAGVMIMPAHLPPRVPALELIQTDDRVEAGWPVGDALTVAAPARPTP